MATRLALPARLVLATTAVAALAAVAYVCRRRIIRIAYRIVGANEPFMVTIAAKGFRRKHTVFMTVRLADGSEARVLFKAKSLGGLLDEDVVSSLHRSLRIGDEVTITVGRREMQDNGQELLHMRRRPSSKCASRPTSGSRGLSRRRRASCRRRRRRHRHGHHRRQPRRRRRRSTRISRTGRRS